MCDKFSFMADSMPMVMDGKTEFALLLSDVSNIAKMRFLLSDNVRLVTTRAYRRPSPWQLRKVGSRRHCGQLSRDRVRQEDGANSR